MKRIISCITFLVILLNLSTAQNDEMVDITCQQASDLIQRFNGDTNFIILDLRAKKMHDKEHIENSICHDVFSEDFENWLGKLNTDKVYLLYCTVGYRSGIALKKMKQMGFRNLYHLSDGIRGWKKQGFVTITNEKID